VTSPLFGPDGTELPEPPPVLPDPLLGPAREPPPEVDQRWTPPAPTPAQTADAEQLRRAIAAALGEPEESLPVQPPPPVAAPPLAPPPIEPEPKTPPTGIPLPTSPTAQFQPVPPVPPLPRQAPPQRPVPAWRGTRSPRRQRNPLIQERITRPGSAWVGCLVALIFFVAVAFNAVQAFIGALIDLFR
jgi:hypothetical protein